MILYSNIKKIIDDWDPVELLITHAPPDEYDGETKEIFASLHISDSINVHIVSKIIFDTFSKRFGSDVFTKNLKECEIIAKKIILFS
ncbi:hypothetical protein V6615_13470 [Oscillospiraceae bacterium PP1C4]